MPESLSQVSASLPDIYFGDQNADNEKPLNILKPFPGRVVVWEDKFKYSGKLVIPDVAKRKPTIGIVLAVGDGVGAHIRPGMRVVFPLYSGTAYYFKGCARIRVLTPDEIHGEILPGHENVELEDTGT